MNTCTIELMPMGPHVLVREKPNGAVLRARQSATQMDLMGCPVLVSDWIVERADSDQSDEDLMLVRQDEFDRAWEVLGLHPEEDRPC